MIYHVTTEAEWEQAQKIGHYLAPSLHTEGFIHCSMQNQVAGVLERYYQNQKNLLLLHIAPELLVADLKYEWADSVGEEFPHVYGTINLDEVTKVEPL